MIKSFGSSCQSLTCTPRNSAKETGDQETGELDHTVKIIHADSSLSSFSLSTAAFEGEEGARGQEAVVGFIESMTCCSQRKIQKLK